MSRYPEAPQGLVGVRPRDPIGVVVTLGVKSASGAPVDKNRFHLMSPVTASAEFRGGGRAYRGLRREPSPFFAEWNTAAAKDDPRCRTLCGNIVHARFLDAVRWNRGAHKLPEPHPNPPSQRPCCQGNGVEALRFVGMEGTEERFDSIACPNELCEFAMSKLCKPRASLLFRLRWTNGDPFPSLLAQWSTHGWYSLDALLGLFELVLGTEVVAPHKPREEWRTGLAAELGVAEPSLVGMPFVMTVGERTKPSEQRRFPVVNFSPDGDLTDWLLAQRRSRAELSGVGAPCALPPGHDDDEVKAVVLEAHREWEVEAIPAEMTTTTPPTGDRPPPGFMSREEVDTLFTETEALGLPRERLTAKLFGDGGAGYYDGSDTIPTGDRERILTWARAAATKIAGKMTPAAYASLCREAGKFGGEAEFRAHVAAEYEDETAVPMKDEGALLAWIQARGAKVARERKGKR